MILEQQSFKEITPTEYDLESQKKFIELCGRVCYRSEHLITEDSYKDFYDRAIKRGHLAILEHATVYMIMDAYTVYHLFYKINKYSETVIKNGQCYITTNLRVIVENDRWKDLKFLVDKPTIYHKKRRSVMMRVDIQVYKELTRHREASFCIESTRYCNYASDKFSNHIRFSVPYWFNVGPILQTYIDKKKPIQYEDLSVFGKELSSDQAEYLICLIDTEWRYVTLSTHISPQAAAGILPQNTMATIVLTAGEQEWEHIFDLRALGKTGTPHPATKNIMMQIYNSFK